MSAMSVQAVDALRLAGWHECRRKEISDWVLHLEGDGYTINSHAEAVLAAFGGLVAGPVNTRGPNFSNDEPLRFDPLDAGFGHYVFAEDLERELGGSWYPIAEWLSSCSVFVDPTGWVVATGLDWIWELGASVEEAIDFALTANKPLRCLRVLTPGVPPYPRS
jgi:SUKH-3 immunity protein